MGSWNYSNPVKLIVGSGALDRLPEYVPYQRIVLVTSGGFTRRGVTARVSAFLGDRLRLVLDDVQPNPGISDIDAQAPLVRSHDPDCIVALGGGSSMDTAKALARLIPQDPDVTLARHFRDGHRWNTSPALPLVTVPTTAGTGSEVTPFATVWDHENQRKHSVVGDDLYADVAILDPELTRSLPREVVVSSGLDAVSHAFESTWNRNANPITLGLAAKSLQLSMRALPVLARDPGDDGARRMMAEASLMAGLSISHTRTALAHSMSYPLTAHTGLPHGVACSFTLPVLLKFNAEADDGRIADLARSAGFSSVDDLGAALATVFRDVGIARLFKDHIPDPQKCMSLSAEMFTPGRADNNLRELGRSNDIEEILQASLELMREW